MTVALVTVLAVMNFIVMAQTKALTEDGKKVLLDPSGKWEYDFRVDSEDLNTAFWILARQARDAEDFEVAMYAFEHLVDREASSERRNEAHYYLGVAQLTLRQRDDAIRNLVICSKDEDHPFAQPCQEMLEKVDSVKDLYDPPPPRDREVGRP